jgi:hypothetical protein
MTRVMASPGLATCRRNAEAMAATRRELSSYWPALRSAAKICGAARVRTRQVSSPKLMSRGENAEALRNHQHGGEFGVKSHSGQTLEIDGDVFMSRRPRRLQWSART